MAFVKFIRGLEASYNATTHADAIYFATDTKKILLNGDVYGGGNERLVSDVLLDEDGLGITIKFTEGADKSIKFPLASADDPDQAGLITWADLIGIKYQSAMPDDLTTPTANGGIPAGTSVATLKEKTVDEIIDMLLFPELQPTVVAPSASIALKTGFSNNGVYEVGAAAPAAETNFTTTFNRGSGKVAGQADKYRAGELDSDNSFIYYGTSTSNTTLPTTVPLGATSYKYHAAYAAGDTLVTSYGNAASVNPNPLPAGSVDSSAVTINGTYPYYCNGVSASSSAQATSLPTTVTPDTKLPLVTWTTTLIGAAFASEAATGTRLEFYYPSAKSVTKVEFMNTVSGKWEAFTSYETAATGTKEIQGSPIEYSKLTTTGSLNGALQLRFTVANA